MVELTGVKIREKGEGEGGGEGGGVRVYLLIVHHPLVSTKAGASPASTIFLWRCFKFPNLKPISTNCVISKAMESSLLTAGTNLLFPFLSGYADFSPSMPSGDDGLTPSFLSAGFAHGYEIATLQALKNLCRCFLLHNYEEVFHSTQIFVSYLRHEFLIVASLMLPTLGPDGAILLLPMQIKKVLHKIYMSSQLIVWSPTFPICNFFAPFNFSLSICKIQMEMKFK